MVTVTELVKVPPLGAMTGVATNELTLPKIVKAPWPPTYTLPLATVGTVNFIAPAGKSRLPAWLLL